MFPDPANAKEARERAFFEPLAEIIQHKGASECRFDRLAGQGVQTTDELCTFEQLTRDTLNTIAPDVPIDEFPPRNMMRNVLKDGLALAPEFGGVNPFKHGFVGSTDDHSGAPGNTVEPDFQGHAGTDDAPVAPLLDNIRLGPGGLAVVWAEENSRDSLFTAMRRKETYGTSGTRPVVRFFGGWDYPAGGQLCGRKDRVRIAYDQGVPMGGGPAEALARPEPPLPGRGTQGPGQRSPAAHPDRQGLGRRRGRDPRGGRRRGRRRGQRCGRRHGHLQAQGQGLQGAVHGLGGPGVRRRRSPPSTTPACWRTRPAAGARSSARRPGSTRSPAPRSASSRPRSPTPRRWPDGEIESGETPFSNCCLTEQNDPFMERTIQERAWTSPIWYAPSGP